MKYINVVEKSEKSARKYKKRLNVREAQAASLLINTEEESYTVKQLAFCREFITNGGQARAAYRAVYNCKTEATANIGTHQLMTTPKIRAKIEEFRKMHNPDHMGLHVVGVGKKSFPYNPDEVIQWAQTGMNDQQILARINVDPKAEIPKILRQTIDHGRSIAIERFGKIVGKVADSGDHRAAVDLLKAVSSGMGWTPPQSQAAKEKPEPSIKPIVFKTAKADKT